MKHVEVQKYLCKLINKQSEEAKVDAAWVLNKAVALHNNAVKAKDRSNAARSLEIVGKHVDILAFDTTVRHTGHEGGPVEIDHNLKVTFIDPDDKQT